MLEAIEKRSDPVKVHKIATEYFKAFRSERGLIEDEKLHKGTKNDLKSPSEELEKREIQKHSESTPVINAKKKNDTIEPLDATHTSSEARVYSVMYRETISMGTNSQYIGIKRLMTLTGIRGDHTVRRAIDGLIQKMSIEIVDANYGNPIGPRYRVFSPKEIIERRKKSRIEIDPQTKKIVTPVATPVILTGVELDIPYIKENNKKDDSIKNIESSSKSLSNMEDKIDDEAFNHRVYIISLYEKYIR